MVNNELYARVKIGKCLSDNFKLHKGIRQGDALAPLLFNVVLEIAVRKSYVETAGTIFTKCNQIIAYADDVVIMGRRLDDVKDTFVALEEQTKKFGLIINENKTKLMTVSKKAFRENQNLVIQTYSFEVVKEFTYLGTLITNNNELRPEIEKRIFNANRAYYALLPVLKSQAIYRTEKIRIYKTLIRPVLTYGAEAWTMKVEMIKRLAVFERKVLRKILGAVRVNDIWRRRYNSELMALYEDLDLVSFIKLNRLRWIGHIYRMENTRKVTRYFIIIHKDLAREADQSIDGWMI